MRSLAIHARALVCAAALSAPAAALSAPTVTVSPTGAASGLQLDGEGSASTHIVKVAAVQAGTQHAAGLTLSVTVGALGKASGGAPIAVQVALVTDGTGSPSAADFTVASGATLTLSTSASGTVARGLYIKYTPAALQDPGAYATSVAVSVHDN